MSPLSTLIANAWFFVSQERKKFSVIVLVFVMVHILFFLPYLLANPSAPKISRSLLQGMSNLVLSLCVLFILAWIISFSLEALQNHSTTYFSTLKKTWSHFDHFLLATLIGGALIGLGTVLLVIPGIIFFIWFGFTPYLIMLGKANAWTAFQKSKLLVDGLFWQTLLRRAGYGIFFLLALLFLRSMLFIAIGSLCGKPGIFLGAGTLTGSFPLSYKFIEIVIKSAVTGLIMPFVVTCDLLLVSDLFRQKAVTK